MVGKGSDICLWSAPPLAALSVTRAKDALNQCGPGFSRSLTGLAPSWTTSAMEAALANCPLNIAEDIKRCVERRTRPHLYRPSTDSTDAHTWV